MEDTSKENVYKQIILQQQELIKGLVYQVSEGGRQTLSPALNFELEDLQRKLQSIFQVRKSSSVSIKNIPEDQAHQNDVEEEFDIGAYEGSDARTSSVPPHRETWNSSSAPSRPESNGRFEDRPDAQEATHLENIPSHQNSINNPPMPPFLDKSPLHIPFVPERVSSAAPSIPEQQVATMQSQGQPQGEILLDRRITDIKQYEAPLAARDTQHQQPVPALFGARTDSIPEMKIVTKTDSVHSLNLITTTNLQITPFKIQIKRGNPASNQILSFTFKLSTENRVIGFIEKTRVEFVAIEQAIRNHYPLELVQKLGPFPEKAEFSGNANGKQTGALLQNWISNAISTCVDFPALLDFLSSNSVPPPIVKESFRKQGNLTKKGNYFGGWKTRHFNLDSSSATVFYADAKQSEILGSFSLQYAYVIAMSAQSTGQKSSDTLEKPGFIVSEYKKAQFLPNAVTQEGINQDGLPLGKIDVRHVFYSESIADRDAWVRCLAGVIARIRPNDEVAQDLFKRTAAPELKEANWPSLESLTNSGRPSQTIVTPSTMAKRQEPLERARKGSVENLKEPQDRARKGSVENLKPSSPEWSSENRNRAKVGPINTRAATTTSATFPGDENLASPSSNAPATVTGAAFPNRVSFQKDTAEDSSTPTVSSPTSTRPSAGVRGGKPRYVDDQTRCMQQSLPPTLQEELEITPTKAVVPDFLKKKASSKGKFTEWMKQAAKSSQDILNKDHRRESGKSTNVLKMPLFGVTIQDATNASRIKPEVDIPAIVYRCIEYLDAKKAADEEGLYRLSGASSVITGLKQKFEEEGDVSLLEVDEYYDPHAIAGLLKLFFRELSEPLFTFQLRMNFFQVAELVDRDQKIAGTIELLRRLPSANYACLRSLLAHLLRVVQKSDINKMTVRNVSIVFSPTLGVPAGLFTMMLAEFSTVFPWGPMDPARTDGSAGPVLSLQLPPPPSNGTPLPVIIGSPISPTENSMMNNDMIPDVLPESNSVAVQPKKQSVRNGMSPSKGFTFIPPENAINGSSESLAAGPEKGEGSDNVDIMQPYIPARTVSQPTHSKPPSSVSASSGGASSRHGRQISEDTNNLLNQVITPTVLADRFKGGLPDHDEEELDMMLVLQKQLDSMDK